MKDKILFNLVVFIHTILFFTYTTLIAVAFETTLTIFIATYIAMFIVSKVALPITAIEIYILELFLDFFIKKQKVF